MRKNYVRGTIVSDTAPGVSEIFAFTGKMFDITIGLQWNINRWYDPQLGQWVQEDPIGFAGGDENLRRYGNNAPTNNIDPDGLNWFSWLFGFDSGDDDWQRLVDEEYQLVQQLNAMVGSSHTTLPAFTPSQRQQINSQLGKSFDFDNAPSRQFRKSLQERDCVFAASETSLQVADTAATGAEVLAAAPVAGVKVAAKQGVKQLTKGQKAAQAAKSLLKAGEEVIDVAKNNRDANRAKGIPDSQLGPSGKPKIHSVDHPTRKTAKDAARQDGKGRPIHHPNDVGQPPHFHAVDECGKKIGKQSPHHNYPRSQK